MAINLADILKLEPEFRGKLADSSIGFVKFTPGQEGDFELAGSGTLIACGKLRGILTADHVLQNLPNTGAIGIVPVTSLDCQNRRVNQLKFDVEHASKITVGKCSNTQQGPDLGVLSLPQTVVSKLEALGKPFYNVTARKNRMLDMSSRKPGFWVFAGMVNEWTEDVPPYGQYKRVRAFRGANVIFNLATVREKDGFDYLSLKLHCDVDGKMPKSFQGCSGGGIWQILFKDQNGALSIEDMLLSGVAFFENPLSKVVTEIECHGIKSIYDRTIELLMNLPRA